MKKTFLVSYSVRNIYNVAYKLFSLKIISNNTKRCRTTPRPLYKNREALLRKCLKKSLSNSAMGLVEVITLRI